MSTTISGLGLAQQDAVGVVLPPVAAENLPRLLLYPDVTGRRDSSFVVLVAAPNGRMIGELRGDLVGAAWKLNSHGQARIELARERVPERLAQPGNRLAILFDNGLPAWGGVVDLPRPWRGPVFELSAYTAEILLTWRNTAGRPERTGTAGEVLLQLLGEARGDGDLGLEVGEVWDGGESRPWELYTNKLSGALATLASAGDYYVEPSLERGALLFYLHFVERRGAERWRNVVLQEGRNLVEPSLNEQGPLVNQWRVEGASLGAGMVFTDARYVGEAVDADSVEMYGLRQDALTNSALTTQAMVDYEAGVNLAATSQPHEVIGLDAIDRSPARFQDYGVGDTVWCEVYSQGYGGFSGPRRLTAREFLPADGVCRLVMV